jgi:hypothetical protein
MARSESMVDCNTAVRIMVVAVVHGWCDNGIAGLVRVEGCEDGRRHTQSCGSQVD